MKKAGMNLRLGIDWSRSRSWAVSDFLHFQVNSIMIKLSNAATSVNQLEHIVGRDDKVCVFI